MACLSALSISSGASIEPRYIVGIALALEAASRSYIARIGLGIEDALLLVYPLFDSLVRAFWVPKS